MARILLIDDEPGLLSTIGQFLTLAGYEVLTASCATDALPLMDRHEFDAVVSDIVMPGMTGLELMQEAKDRQEDTRFIFMTGEPSAASAAEAVRLGAFDYLTKPVRLPDLRDAVERAVASKGKALQSREHRRRLETLVKKQTEELEESLERYQEIFNAVTDAIIIYRPDGVIMEANCSACRISGYTHDELIGMNGILLVAQESLEDFQRFMGRVNDDHTYSLEARGKTKQGETLYFEVSGKRFNYQGKPHLIAILKDVTQRQQAQDLLRKFRMLVELSSDFIGLAALDGRSEFMNEAARKLAGLPLDMDVTTLRIQDFFGENGQEFFETTFMPNLRKLGKTSTHDYIRNVSTGEHTPVEINTFLLPGENDSGFGGIATVMHDMTERKKYEEQLRQSNMQLEIALQGTVRAMANLLESRDPYTAGHQRRVAYLAKLIAERLGFSQEAIEGLFVAGIVHDVGKISVPTEILTKPGRLTELEFKIIKQHSQRGFEILQPIHFPWPVAEIVVQHHERLDGSGYPHGLQSVDILAESRVLMVADVVEAITSHRPYRAALGMNFAIDVLKQERGTKLDCDAVDVCIDIITDPDFTFG